MPHAAIDLLLKDELNSENLKELEKELNKASPKKQEKIYRNAQKIASIRPMLFYIWLY